MIEPLRLDFPNPLATDFEQFQSVSGNGNLLFLFGMTKKLNELIEAHNKLEEALKTPPDKHLSIISDLPINPDAL